MIRLVDDSEEVLSDRLKAAFVKLKEGTEKA